MPNSILLGLQNKNSLNLKQMQRLIMSPQMQQAIHLLQTPILELAPIIEAELAQNPILESISDPLDECDDNDMQEMVSDEEYDCDLPVEKELDFNERDFNILQQLDEDFRDHFAQSGTFTIKKSADEQKQQTYLENSLCTEASLFEYLMMQAKETFLQQEELCMAEAIIGNCDAHGYLQTSLQEISILYNFSEDKLNAILKVIQTFEPYGVGATHVQESLLIQLRCLAKEKTLAATILEKHYEDLLHNRIPRIQNALGCSTEQISDAIKYDIARLNLHPGSSYAREAVQYITPDATLHQEGEELFVTINNEFIPSLRLNPRYMRMMQDDALPPATKEFIRNKILSAKWLLLNIHQRNETIEKIVQSLARRQKEYFTSSFAGLVPLTMKMIAEELSLHESTIARAVSNKYLYCSRGLLPLRSFFTNAYVDDQGKDISSKTVRDVLKEIICNEDKHTPLSDETLSTLLKIKGISCARRTIAKYRRELNLGNAQQRRKF